MKLPYLRPHAQVICFRPATPIANEELDPLSDENDNGYVDFWDADLKEEQSDAT